MDATALEETAQTLVALGKGILAADESTATIEKRFARAGVPSTEEARRAYREALFTTPGVESFLSGAILFDETIRQTSSDGTPFPGLLSQKGILPGIKVDRGTTALPGFPGERVTEGLDGLFERLAEYRALGARFAKWRAVIAVGLGLPTETCLAVNAHALARYAALCQEAGLVPIVEPEVLMDGDHPLERCEEATEAALAHLFGELRRQRVRLEGTVLKPNMVLSGKSCPRQEGVERVAEATLRVLRRTVPAAVPGIAFLSGGQSALLATAHLQALNALGPHPWRLTFSYSRAIQEPALAAWQGKRENVARAQRVLLERACLNAAASRGSYSADMERATS
jgi:fructose-bisphosphate aldolase class I